MTPLTVSRVEAVRAMLRKLPHVAETVQWGGNLVFWAGDKAIGGKMFALVELEDVTGPVLAFAAGPERALLLLENEGVIPAPYLARAHWVALQQWSALPYRQLLEELREAHDYVAGRLPRRVQRVLELSPKEYRLAVQEARRAAKATAAT